MKKKADKDSQKAKQKEIEVSCECCGTPLDLEDYGFYRSYDEQKKKWSFFCNAECIATWFGEEVEGEDIVAELEEQGYKVLNKPESFDDEDEEEDEE